MKNQSSIILFDVVAIYPPIMCTILRNTQHGRRNSYIFGKEYYMGYALFYSGLTVARRDQISGVSMGINGSRTALVDAAI